MTRKEILAELMDECIYFGNTFDPQELERMRTEAISQVNTADVRKLINDFFDAAETINGKAAGRVPIDTSGKGISLD